MEPSCQMLGAFIRTTSSVLKTAPVLRYSGFYPANIDAATNSKPAAMADINAAMRYRGRHTSSSIQK